MPSFQLVVRRGPKAGEKFQLKTQTVIIGRDSTADIHLNDPEVSRNHCRLILDESYYLQDLGSTNGSFVDGTRLGGEPVRLNNGQIIQLGSNVTLLYQELSDDSSVMATMFAMPGEELPDDDSTSLYDYESDPEMQAAAAAQEPVYQEPAYQEPAYQEPAYQEPAYQEPAAQYESSLPDEPTMQESAAFEDAKQKQRRNYWIIGIIVGVLLLCCLCGLIGSGISYMQNEGLFDIPTAFDIVSNQFV